MIFAGLAGAVILASGAWFARNDRVRMVEAIRALEAEMERRVAERDAMIRRLSRERRVAHIHVVRQQRSLDGSVVQTDMLVIELDDDGREIARQEVHVPGSVVHIDALTVRFDRESVAAGHPFRGQTLILLRRIYSDALAPRDGVNLDIPGAVPDGYAAGDAAHFEREIWRDFWRMAGDSTYAAQRGVRVAQGESVYLPMEEGRVYELRVEAAGGMVLVPLHMRAMTLTGAFDGGK